MKTEEKQRIMNKICTNIEQSQKLIELGVDVNTADMWYLPNKKSYELVTKPSLTRGIIPAWSLAALLELLDYEIVDEKGESCYLKIDKDDIKYQVRYEYKWYGGFESKWYDNLIDACVEIVVKLKEQKIL